MRNNVIPRVVAGAAVFLAALLAAADAAEVRVQDAWIRALPPPIPSGGYFTLHNEGGRDLVLTGAASPACGMLMLHKSDETGGMSLMQDVMEVAVPAGATVKFAPGGYHLMCMKSHVRPDAKVPVTLSFKDGSSLTAQFSVRNAAGQ